MEFKHLDHFIFKNCQIGGKKKKNQEILKQNYNLEFPDIVKPHSR